jgi:hypothetical protein
MKFSALNAEINIVSSPYKFQIILFLLSLKEALATILTKKNYMFWKLVNIFKMMK